MATATDLQQALRANQLKTVTMGYIGGPVCVVGIVTSALSLVLFKRDTSTTLSTRLLLSAIAVVDIFFLLFMSLFWSVKRFLPQDSTAFQQFENPVVFAFIFYMSNVFELYRNWLVVVIAVERLLYFLKPVEFKFLWSVKKVAAILIFLCLSSCFIRIPVLIYGIARKSPKIGDSITRLTRLMHSLIDCVVLTIAPVTLMVTLSVATTLRIHAVVKTKLRLVNSNFIQPTDQGYQQHVAKQDDAPSRKHYRIVKILHTVLITFIICSTPSIPASVMHFYIVFHEIEGGRIKYVSEVLTVIANFGSLVNSTSNFFVYVAHSKRYRYILAKILMLDRCFSSIHREPSSTQETCCNLQEDGKTQ
ncbi:unnamed protein product [Mesocestoides corti]|uniref:G_PROTEIN_RECEP_F1_2 domain-containing protein n=1 Tax=Mesocestoides corti TaxID=53468 RepID=A0A0R3U4L3_MESCO|nr:unnamed protein product [Mesocestoides corti]